MAYQDGNDLKTFIPGVGFLVTSLETGESHMFAVPEVEDTEAEENELALQAQCQQYDDDLMHYEDNVDF